MDNDKAKIKASVFFVTIYLAILWVVKIFELASGISLSHFGVLPGSVSHLYGIVTFPLLHGSVNHLVSNTFPLLVLGVAVLYFYPNASLKVVPMAYFIPGIVIWFLGRGSYHIGSSGIVYALAAFLFFAGIFRKDAASASVAMIVVFLYGGLIWGILPVEEGVSWEGHLGGAIAGVIAAIFFRKDDPNTKKYSWEEDDEDDDDFDVRELRIRHDK